MAPCLVDRNVQFMTAKIISESHVHPCLRDTTQANLLMLVSFDFPESDLSACNLESICLHPDG